MSTINELVAALYPALARGDRDTIARLVAPDFQGTLTEGLPMGGVHHGREAMTENGWWAFGRAFKVRAEPAQWLSCPDGRLLVIGRYVGSARTSGVPIDAAFVHLWSADADQLTSVWQLTDSALFVNALERTGDDHH
ncbi:MAG: nuclear transport factor 2 family protein [Actinomycetota bacterium]